MSEETLSLSFQTLSDEAGVRLDAFLAGKIDGWSRARLVRLIEDGEALVNGVTSKASYRIKENDEIEIELTEIPAAKFEPENIPLDVRFEDPYLAVINKPAGLVVHPGAGVSSGTLANALAHHFEIERGSGGSQAENRLGIVHRLDKDTSGLIVIAKTDDVHVALSEQFRERQVYKSYVALVHGSPETNSGTVQASIARNKHNRLRMKVAAHGRSAVSLWKVRKRYDKFTLLDVEIKTGRTHQIRVHMGYINHPIVGDEIYNEGRDKTVNDINVRNAIRNLGRFFLHAERLSFTHPKTGERLEFVQEMSDELNEFLNLL